MIGPVVLNGQRTLIVSAPSLYRFSVAKSLHAQPPLYPTKEGEA